MICRWCGLIAMNLFILSGLVMYLFSKLPSKPLSPGLSYLNKLKEFRETTSEQVDWALQKNSFLVIGGTGFTGGNLVDDLLARGAKKVRVVARRIPKKKKERVEYVKGSITDLSQMQMAVKGMSVVFHTAAYYGNPEQTQFGSSKKCFDINKGGIENVVKACKDQKVGLLIYTSSVDTVFNPPAYGDKGFNITEDTPYADDYTGSHYTHSKIAAESHCLKSDGTNGLRTMSLRPNGIIGPGENWFIPKAIAPFFMMGVCPIYFGWEQWTDWSAVYNIAWAHMLAVARFEDNPDAIGGKAYFITDGEKTNGLKAFQPYIEAVGAAFKPLFRIPPSLLPKFGYFSEVLHSYTSIPPFLTTHEAYKSVTTHTHSTARAKADFGYVPLLSTTENAAYTAEEISRRYGLS